MSLSACTSWCLCASTFSPGGGGGSSFPCKITASHNKRIVPPKEADKGGGCQLSRKNDSKSQQTHRAPQGGRQISLIAGLASLRSWPPSMTTSSNLTATGMCIWTTATLGLAETTAGHPVSWRSVNTVLRNCMKCCNSATGCAGEFTATKSDWSWSRSGKGSTYNFQGIEITAQEEEEEITSSQQSVDRNDSWPPSGLDVGDCAMNGHFKAHSLTA